MVGWRGYRPSLLMGKSTSPSEKGEKEEAAKEGGSKPKRGRPRKPLPWNGIGKLWARLNPVENTEEVWNSLTVEQQHEIKKKGGWPVRKYYKKPKPDKDKEGSGES